MIKPRYTVTAVVETDTLEQAEYVARRMDSVLHDAPGSVHVGDPVAVRTAASKLDHYVWLFTSNAIDKFEFYDATKHYDARVVAKAADIDVDVVQDRRRYLRQLARQH